MFALFFVAIFTCVPNHNSIIEEPQPKIQVTKYPTLSDQLKKLGDQPTSTLAPLLASLPNIEAKDLIESKTKNAKTYFQLKKMHSFSEEEIAKYSALTSAEVKTIARKKVVTKLIAHLENKKQ